MSDTTSQTAEVTRAYFDAWTSRKGPDAIRPLMREDFSFASAMFSVEGREPFLAAGQWPEHATTTMVAEAYDGEHAFHLYEAANNGVSVRVAEHLVVRDAKLAAAEIVVDGDAFMAFMQAG